MDYKKIILFFIFTLPLFSFFGGGTCPPCICQEHSSIHSEISLYKNQRLTIQQINKKLNETINQLKKLKQIKNERLKKLQIIYQLKTKNTILLKKIINQLEKQKQLLYLELKKINNNTKKIILKNKKNLKNDIIFQKNLK